MLGVGTYQIYRFEDFNVGVCGFLREHTADALEEHSLRSTYTS